MRAKNREQYVQAWKAHCTQIGLLLIAADATEDEYNDMKARLDALIERAANRQSFQQDNAGD